MKQYEVNFDGLVGPTHNYGGLSFGNVASSSNAQAISNPKEAAKQGLVKMKALADMGMQQGFLAPQERPNVHALRRIGFTGTDSDVLYKAATTAPEILQTVSSASSMWTANAATISPGADTADGRVHFTPANLTNKFHRSLEPVVTGRILKAIFNNHKYFEHHMHLPDNDHFGDEGAANHTRLCSDYGQEGVELFVFGKYGFDQTKPAPTKYPARQTLEACQAIARLHGLSDDNVVYIQQNPEVIDQGVFHNDVISVGNQNVLFYHEDAFLNTDAKFDEIRTKFIGDEIHFIKVRREDVTVAEAVKTYLFNTQIITLPDGDMTIIAPTECEQSTSVNNYLSRLVDMGTPIKQVKYFDVKQSMRNGGGPACLRLRVALTEDELEAVNQHALLTDESFNKLNAWVDKHYRDHLTIDDLKDPQLLIESRTALDELTQIMKLGSVYTFQQD